VGAARRPAVAPPTARPLRRPAVGLPTGSAVGRRRQSAVGRRATGRRTADGRCGSCRDDRQHRFPPGKATATRPPPPRKTIPPTAVAPRGATGSRPKGFVGVGTSRGCFFSNRNPRKNPDTLFHFFRKFFPAPQWGAQALAGQPLGRRRERVVAGEETEKASRQSGEGQSAGNGNGPGKTGRASGGGSCCCRGGLRAAASGPWPAGPARGPNSRGNSVLSRRLASARRPGRPGSLAGA